MSTDDPSAMSPNPFAELLGIEITEMEDGYARGELELDPELWSTPDSTIAHGGVTYSLADQTGAAAAISLGHWPAPTIDMRIDYLNPATDDLRAEAEVLRAGGSVATVSVDVSTPSDGAVAVAHGLYKVSGSDGSNAWVDG